MFLVIFFCLEGYVYMQIPIYLYLFSLQWNNTRTSLHKSLFLIMLIVCGVITGIADLPISMDIVLRIAAVLLVIKDVFGEY